MGIIPANSEILSFYIPYYNPKNDDFLEVKVTRGVDYSNGNIQLPQPLNKNGDPLEIDVDPKYFFFLK